MRDSTCRWKVAMAASRVRRIWAGVNMCLKPLDGGMMGTMEFLEVVAPPFARNSLNFVRALNSGSATMSFSFC